MEEINRKELLEIENAVYKKLKHLEKEDFLRKNKWEPDELMDYEAMVEMLAEVVQQHIWDEDLQWPCNLDNIPESQWDEWLEEYEVPEPCCNRCGGRGCNYCLMCSY